ncbi:PhzF family phenazine biosynthesis isomerase [Virgibacillus sp. LDC1]|uniref:PhzF family phenazine biosynthesis isomerase n=1 Tax=unclassified Paenibacillus TaxID=185978 RepID=UPI000C26E102|nr:PhzF family phenazine biosynthesis isomerase [Paenibacillus sp. GM2FR]MCV4232325.1 PhzF family phenazine biosynthesis isomerase [Virgibacillus sp. LDC1]PJN56311.1 putative isomerase YddE [Paenibacillus sp. GM2FR]
MKSINVLHYDAFSVQPNKGNPAGVVLNADDLAEEEMQSIARSVGFNETTFILKSEQADIRLRYFTPGHEMNLCGHATMASMYALKTKGLLPEKETVWMETKVGILPIEFQNAEGQLTMKMKQDHPQFISYGGDVDRLASSIGLKRDDLDFSMPIVYGSTGIWTLLVPIKGLEHFDRMVPDNAAFPDILTKNPKASLHPFCLETMDGSSFMHARHFSSPYSGTVEDPVTGTASGVMGAYYLTYLNPEISSARFTIEQGQEMGKDGRVQVQVERWKETMDVYISGTAVFVKEFQVSY